MTWNSDIAPVETNYGGIRFRSRLEARWAVFFDVVGIEYQYEPEKYETPNGRYIPDFFLPNLAAFLEVKGVPPSLEEFSKAMHLAVKSNCEVYIFHGSDFRRGIYVCQSSSKDGVGRVSANFTQCVLCGWTDIGLTSGNNTGCWHQCSHQRYAFDIDVTAISPLLEIGYEAALSARFEDPAGIGFTKAMIRTGAILRATHKAWVRSVDELASHASCEYSTLRKQPERTGA